MCLLWCLAESKTKFEVFLNGSEVCKGLGSENPTCLVGKRRVKGSTALEDFHERLFYAHTNLFDFTGVPM